MGTCWARSSLIKLCEFNPSVIEYNPVSYSDDQTEILFFPYLSVISLVKIIAWVR